MNPKPTVKRTAWHRWQPYRKKDRFQWKCSRCSKVEGNGAQDPPDIGGCLPR